MPRVWDMGLLPESTLHQLSDVMLSCTYERRVSRSAILTAERRAWAGIFAGADQVCGKA